jgi:transcriptional regulator with PAS, ATPase and Fis domain
MKILLAWIGKTDLNAAEGVPEAGSGPICAAVTGSRYDRVILLNNYPAKESSRYLQWLRQRTDSEIDHQYVSLTSPTDFGEIYKAAMQAIEQARKKLGSDVRLTFHLSPGTPAMYAVWIILSRMRYPAELIESSKKGGVQRVSIPFDISAEFIPDLMRRRDEELERLSSGAAPEFAAFSNIIHRSEPMKRALAMAQNVAVRNVPVLIEGESGTGKELLARAIHQSSRRHDKPFIAVNCGAIPAELVESELFGHEQGAFSGAIKKRIGHFVNAHGGTIFLDELGELPLSAQVKLLRVIQEREVTPLGSSKPQKIDVRVISATNRSLISEVSIGNFREDLFYRLAVSVLRLPPLRDREGDLGLLIDNILKMLNEQSEIELGLKHKKLSPGAKTLLLNHHWPGNVRELQNTLLRATISSSGDRIEEEDIRAAILPAIAVERDNLLTRPLGNGFDLQDLLSRVARHYLEKALAEAKDNKTEAAKLVGLPSYQTLTNWLKRYGVAESK